MLVRLGSRELLLLVLSYTKDVGERCWRFENIYSHLFKYLILENENIQDKTKNNVKGW